MNIDADLLDNLKTMALTSGHPKVWVAAALVHRNKVVSYGVNAMKTHPYQHRYGRNNECVYWHAETLAIYTADKRLGFTKFNKATLYVARLKFNNPDKTKLISGLAKPCSGCMRCISDYGIPRIIYTLDHEETVSEHYGTMIF
jgi:tRNA(Arg) A34 adenosine deaminase TadA